MGKRIGAYELFGIIIIGMVLAGCGNKSGTEQQRQSASQLTESDQQVQSVLQNTEKLNASLAQAQEAQDAALQKVQQSLEQARKNEEQRRLEMEKHLAEAKRQSDEEMARRAEWKRQRDERIAETKTKMAPDASKREITNTKHMLNSKLSELVNQFEKDNPLVATLPEYTTGVSQIRAQIQSGGITNLDGAAELYEQYRNLAVPPEHIVAQLNVSPEHAVKYIELMAAKNDPALKAIIDKLDASATRDALKVMVNILPKIKQDWADEMLSVKLDGLIDVDVIRVALESLAHSPRPATIPALCNLYMSLPSVKHDIKKSIALLISLSADPKYGDVVWKAVSTISEPDFRTYYMLEAAIRNGSTNAIAHLYEVLLKEEEILKSFRELGLDGALHISEALNSIDVDGWPLVEKYIAARMNGVFQTAMYDNLVIYWADLLKPGHEEAYAYAVGFTPEYTRYMQELRLGRLIEGGNYNFKTRPEMRDGLHKYLTRFDTSFIREFYLQQLRSEFNQERLIASRYLASISENRAVPILRELIDDPWAGILPAYISGTIQSSVPNHAILTYIESLIQLERAAAMEMLGKTLMRETTFSKQAGEVRVASPVDVWVEVTAVPEVRRLLLQYAQDVQLESIGAAVESILLNDTDAGLLKTSALYVLQNPSSKYIPSLDKALAQLDAQLGREQEFAAGLILSCKLACMGPTWAPSYIDIVKAQYGSTKFDGALFGLGIMGGESANMALDGIEKYIGKPAYFKGQFSGQGELRYWMEYCERKTDLDRCGVFLASRNREHIISDDTKYSFEYDYEKMLMKAREKVLPTIESPTSLARRLELSLSW